MPVNQMNSNSFKSNKSKKMKSNKSKDKYNLTLCYKLNKANKKYN